MFVKKPGLLLGFFLLSSRPRFFYPEKKYGLLLNGKILRHDCAFGAYLSGQLKTLDIGAPNGSRNWLGGS